MFSDAPTWSMLTGTTGRAMTGQTATKVGRGHTPRPRRAHTATPAPIAHTHTTPCPPYTSHAHKQPAREPSSPPPKQVEQHGWHQQAHGNGVEDLKHTLQRRHTLGREGRHGCSASSLAVSTNDGGSLGVDADGVGASLGPLLPPNWSLLQQRWPAQPGKGTCGLGPRRVHARWQPPHHPPPGARCKLEGHAGPSLYSHE